MELSSPVTVTIRDDGTNSQNMEVFNAEKNSTSKRKRICSQYCATIAASFLTLSMGINIGFSTILIPELYKKDPEITVTLEQLTWISSLNNILVTVGAIMSGIFAQWLGRRRTIMILTISYIISWTILYHANDIEILFLALIISGLTGGLAESPIQTYVAEISEPNLRGSLSATASMSLTIGIFLQFLIGSYTYWRTLVLINILFPSICFIAMFFVPESPHWLASKNRLRETELTLCWLRGWTNPQNVQQEFQELKKSYYKSPNHSQTRKTFKTIVKPYFKRSVFVPFAIVSFTFFVSCLNGATPILTYAVLLFKQFDSPINEYTATMIMGLLKVVGSFILIFLIRYTGKRVLVLVSLIGTGSAILSIAIYSFIRDYYGIDVKDYSWLPTIMILTAIFVSTVGIKNIPWIMAGEVFPPNVRSVANGVVSSTYNIYSAIANKSFFYMVNEMSLAGTFLFFTSVNILGLTVLYFILPETEGRTLEEIRDHFEGRRNLKDRKVDKITMQELTPLDSTKSNGNALNIIPETEDKINEQVNRHLNGTQNFKNRHIHKINNQELTTLDSTISHGNT